MSVKVVTDKTINPVQLAVELEGLSLTVTPMTDAEGKTITEIVAARGITKAKLQAAVDAHVADASFAPTPGSEQTGLQGATLNTAEAVPAEGAKVKTAKEINLGQLTSELGGVALSQRPATDDVGSPVFEIEVHSADVTAEQLQAAIDAQVMDEYFGQPEQKRLEELAAKASLTPADIAEAMGIIVKKEAERGKRRPELPGAASGAAAPPAAVTERQNLDTQKTSLDQRIEEAVNAPASAGQPVDADAAKADTTEKKP